MPDLVTAVWQGPFTAELPDGTTVENGDSAKIDKVTAETSAHWQITKHRKADD